MVLARQVRTLGKVGVGGPNYAMRYLGSSPTFLGRLSAAVSYGAFLLAPPRVTLA